MGGGYTPRRCDVSGTVDGALVRTGNTIIEGNYFHDFYFSDQSQDQAGSSPPLWTHNDGVQLRMASQGPVRIVGNNFQWYPDETFPAPYDRTAVLRTGYGTSYYRNGLVSPYSGGSCGVRAHRVAGPRPDHAGGVRGQLARGRHVRVPDVHHVARGAADDVRDAAGQPGSGTTSSTSGTGPRIRSGTTPWRRWS